MGLSVVIPTFNQRSALTSCLDTLDERTSTTEVVVVDGPSTDGTTGAILDRSNVDVLLELRTRNINVARNAGISWSSGHNVALLDPRHRVGVAWEQTILEQFEDGVGTVSGPVRPEQRSTTAAHDQPAQSWEQKLLSPGNLAIAREAIVAVDGFDEYLLIGGVADLSDRIHHNGFRQVWHPDMGVDRTGVDVTRTTPHEGARAWFEDDHVDWEGMYRSLSYRLCKNEGLRPRPLATLVHVMLVDGARNATEVFRGRDRPSNWYGNGWAVVHGSLRGIVDARDARGDDHTAAHNPNGLSAGAWEDAIVDSYDWRCQ